jgi:hypothetical protein
VVGYAKGPGGGARPSEQRIATLTGRVCNQQYDVVHYNFTVVMPVRHLQQLERNLMSLNYHTVLNVQMHSAPVMIDSLYYFGNDPVMRITISGELLLLTSWERGTWDAEKDDWSAELPPLMPVEIVRTLPQRSEDKNQ